MRFSTLAGSLAALVLLAACDTAPGPAAPDGRAPIVTNFSFSPESVVFERLPPEQQGNGEARIPFQIEVDARDPDGRVAEVRYVVQSPVGGGTAPVAEGALQPQSGDRFVLNTTLVLPSGEIGNYTVLVFAIDESNRMSGEARGQLTFFSGGEPPVIELVEAVPEVFQPPGTLTLIVTVSDPDGLTNINRVLGTAPNGNEFELLDDGQSFGDAVAGDGRYTASFEVPSATPGVQTFSFQAFDRAGLASNVVTKDVTIQ